MNKVLTALLFLNFFVHSEVEAAAAAAPVREALDQAYLDYCQGKQAQGDEEVSKALAQDPQNADAFFLKNTFIPAIENKWINEILKKYPEGSTNPTDELERLALAYSLISARSDDFARMDELLKFKSAVATREAYRLMLASHLLSLQDKQDESFRLIEQAFKLTGEVDPMYLLGVVWSNPSDPKLVAAQKKYEKMISKFPQKDPYIILMKGFLKAAESNGDYKPIVEFQEAYTQCPIDVTLALSYGTELLLLVYGNTSDGSDVIRYIDESEEILGKLAKERKYYPPSVDLYRGAAALAKGDTEKAQDYFEMAEKASKHLHKGDRQLLEHSLEQLRAPEKGRTTSETTVENFKRPHRKTLVGIFVSLFFLAFLISIAWRRK